MDKVSIVVPVYNKQWCLARCIDSVLAQTYPDFSLILVDDGSKDESLALCRQYALQDPRIRVIAQENGGVSAARNAGIDASTGEYLLFLDADDWWEPNFLETMLSLADQYGPETMVMCGYFRSGQTEQPVLFAPSAADLDSRGIYRIYQKHFLNMLWNKVFLGRAVREQGIRFPVGLHWGEDKLFILAYLKNIRGYHIASAPLYHYDVSDAGLDNRFKKDELQLNEKLHKALFDYEATLEHKTEEGHDMLCAEYMRVQIQGAMRQIKTAKALWPAKQLKQDALLETCMQALRRKGHCSTWLCLCQKHSALLLILSYGLKRKLCHSNHCEGM